MRVLEYLCYEERLRVEVVQHEKAGFVETSLRPSNV